MEQPGGDAWRGGDLRMIAAGAGFLLVSTAAVFFWYNAQPAEESALNLEGLDAGDGRKPGSAPPAAEPMGIIQARSPAAGRAALSRPVQVPEASSLAAAPAEAQGSVGMVRGGPRGLRSPAGAASPESPARERTEAEPRAQLASVAAKYHARYAGAIERHKAKHPAIRQAAKDWRSYPDLRRLQQKNREDHDLVAYAKGLLASKNYRKLVAKYGGSKEVLSMVTEGILTMPEELGRTLRYATQHDGEAYDAGSRLAEVSGLPPALFGLLVRAPRPWGKDPARPKPGAALEGALENPSAAPDRLNKPFAPPKELPRIEDESQVPNP